MSINRVIISGNLTRDPELRSTASGLPVLGFGVAVNDRRKNQQTGEWEDYPNFIDCTMFGARAESLSRYLSKGTKVSIEGKLRWSQWEREGQKRSKIEVIVDELEFMSSRNKTDGYDANAEFAAIPSSLSPDSTASVYVQSTRPSDDEDNRPAWCWWMPLPKYHVDERLLINELLGRDTSGASLEQGRRVEKE